ncbi:MAG: GNAT family N-acetyltransferase [Winogradskyella sp.]|nr:GNAT family N-acetyltransferase [Winogradskyella sp.]
MIKLVRTSSENIDFIYLVKHLDAYLKITDGEEHEFYNQFNSISVIKHVVVAYLNEKPIGCGAIKELSKKNVELKRMFTSEEVRGKGIATQVLFELEQWAKSLNYESIVLETGIRQTEAVQFYKKNLYKIIPNYGQYIGVKNSLCFQKTIKQ